MTLEERLRQLKKISPRADYSDRSRSFILSSSQELIRPRLTVWQFVLQNVQIGSAMALTGLLLLLGFGGFSAWKFLSPFGLSSLDPANLRAEAEAVNDIGVALNSIQYIPPQGGAAGANSSALAKTAAPKAKSQAGASTSSENTPATARGFSATTASSSAASATSEEMATSSASDEFSTTTVDDALDLLLQ